MNVCVCVCVNVKCAYCVLKLRSAGMRDHCVKQATTGLHNDIHTLQSPLQGTQTHRLF